MTTARDITGRDLIRALGDLASVDETVRGRAEAAAAALSGDGIATRVFRRASGRYTVSATGADLFGREFGTMVTAAAPFIGDALTQAKMP